MPDKCVVVRFGEEVVVVINRDRSFLVLLLLQKLPQRIVMGLGQADSQIRVAKVAKFIAVPFHQRTGDALSLLYVFGVHTKRHLVIVGVRVGMIAQLVAPL